MTITDILDLIDAPASARLAAPLIAEALAALPPEEVERARPAARLRGLARLEHNDSVTHVELGLEPTDGEILIALEDPDVDLQLVAQRVCLRMHLAPVAEIEATARAIATSPDPASTLLNRALTPMPWFVIAMARLLRERREKDPRAPGNVILWRGRLLPDTFPADAVLAVVRGDAKAYGPVGAPDVVLPMLQEGDGAHVFANATVAPRPGSHIVWGTPTCLRCVLRLEHAHDDLVGRFSEATNQGNKLAAVAAWDKLAQEDQEHVRAVLGGPRPDLDAIHAGLVAGTLDAAKAAEVLSRWMAFAPIEEMQAAIVTLTEGIEDPHGDTTTAAGRLQAALVDQTLFGFAMARNHRAREDAKEHERERARAENPRVAAIVTRVETCLDGNAGPDEERALAAELAALDDAACALAMWMYLGTEGTPTDDIVEIVARAESWDDSHGTILAYAALRPIDEARRIVSAIPEAKRPELQGVPLGRVVVERLRLADARAAEARVIEAIQGGSEIDEATIATLAEHLGRLPAPEALTLVIRLADAAGDDYERKANLARLTRQLVKHPSYVAAMDAIATITPGLADAPKVRG